MNKTNVRPEGELAVLEWWSSELYRLFTELTGTRCHRESVPQAVPEPVRKVIGKDSFLVVAAIHKVVDRAGILDTQLPRYPER